MASEDLEMITIDGGNFFNSKTEYLLLTLTKIKIVSFLTVEHSS
jgi:hypothetical protein